jgi:hypothetical protein
MKWSGNGQAPQRSAEFPICLIFKNGAVFCLIFSFFKNYHKCKKFRLIARYPKSADFGLKQLSEAVLQRKSGYFKGKLEILINLRN